MLTWQSEGYAHTLIRQHWMSPLGQQQGTPTAICGFIAVWFYYIKVCFFGCVRAALLLASHAHNLQRRVEYILSHKHKILTPWKLKSIQHMHMCILKMFHTSHVHTWPHWIAKCAVLTEVPCINQITGQFFTTLTTWKEQPHTGVCVCVRVWLCHH